MTTARNWTQRIFEPGTTFLIRDQVAQNPGFQVSNNRRAAAYAGDVAGSMILAPLLASTATQIGAGLYNTAAPEALDISAESLANLAALGAMGYGIHRGIARFRNAGSWDGFMGKFADREFIRTPGPRPGPDTGPVPQGPVPWGDSPIYARSIIIEDGTLPVPQRSGPGNIFPTYLRPIATENSNPLVPQGSGPGNIFPTYLRPITITLADLRNNPHASDYLSF